MTLPTIGDFNWSYSWDKVYSDLMEDVWTIGYDEQVMYDIVPAFMDWTFNQSKDMLVGAYDQNHLVGFVGGNYRRIKWGQQILEGYLAHLYSVARAYRHGRVGYRLLTHLLDRVLKNNPQAIVLGYLDVGHETDHLFQRFLKLSPYTGRLLFKTNFYTKILDLKQVDAAEPFTGMDRLGLLGPIRKWIEYLPQPPVTGSIIRPYRPEDLPACLTLLNAYQNKSSLKLARIWTEEELAKQLNYHNFSHTWICERDGQLVGLINYYFMTLRGKINIKVAEMDEVYFDNMSKIEQQTMLATILIHLKNQHVTAMITQNATYFPKTAFNWAHFITYPRYINLVALGWPQTLNQLPDLNPYQLYLEHR